MPSNMLSNSHNDRRLRSSKVLPIILSLYVYSGMVVANNGGVHGPNVKADTSSAEFRMNVNEDNNNLDGREQYRMHYQRALNDSWQVRVLMQYRDYGNFQYDSAKAEFLYNYNKAGSTDINDKYAAGLRFDLRTRRGQNPEDIIINWTHQYAISNNTYVRGIAILGKNITNNTAGEKPSSVGSRFSINTKIDSAWTLSAEMYSVYGELDDVGTVDEQTHQFGPSLSYQKNDWYVYARYLSGLTDATADHNLQVRVGKRF